MQIEINDVELLESMRSWESWETRSGAIVKKDAEQAVVERLEIVGALRDPDGVLIEVTRAAVQLV